MKVFISSLIAGMEAERAAVKGAIKMLGHEPVMAEDFEARSSSPQVACLRGGSGEPDARAPQSAAQSARLSDLIQRRIFTMAPPVVTGHTPRTAASAGPKSR